MEVCRIIKGEAKKEKGGWAGMSAKILLVDDEAAIADLVEVYLTNES